MNQLQVAFIARIPRPAQGQPDKRYRIMVSLIRADRPKNWIFKCVNGDCDYKVCEIVNREVYDIVDFYDPQDVNNNGTLKHCKGTLPSGLACPYSYFFNMH